MKALSVSACVFSLLTYTSVLRAEEAAQDQQASNASVESMRPGGHPRPPGPPPGWGRPGSGGGWHRHPHWRDGWRWDRGYRRPRWYQPRAPLPPYWWRSDIPPGYWQCVAFNPYRQGFAEIGPDLDQAAFSALYACGGPNYEANGCYIPNGYCQFR